MRLVSATSLLIVAALAVACESAPERPAPPDSPPVPAAPAASPQVPAEPGSPAAPAAEANAPTPASPQSPAAPAAPVLVDVRTQQEYDAGHVRGAILIPYDQMEQRWQELAAYRDQPLVLYCRSGRRSGIALEVLKAKGFTQLENGGGMDAMAAKGHVITRN